MQMQNHINTNLKRKVNNLEIYNNKQKIIENNANLLRKVNYLTSTNVLMFALSIAI